MKTKLLLVSLLCVGVLSGLSGCAPSKPKVCATVYPVEYLIQKIGGDYVDTCNISEENTIVQRMNLKENYEDILADADALFFISGLESYMELYLDDIRSTKVDMVDLGITSAIYDFKRYSTAQIDGKFVTAEVPYYEGDMFNNADTYKQDPLLWIDPISMSSMGNSIRDYLKGEFPEYGKAFDENYDTLEIELARLDADFQGLKEADSSISFVTMTPSFGNWQKSYWVNVYPISISKYGALPSDSQLKEIKKRIQNDGVRYIIKEKNLPEDMQMLYDQLVAELGLVTIEMDSISYLSQEDIDANKNYLTMMYENLKLLESMAN